MKVVLDASTVLSLLLRGHSALEITERLSRAEGGVHAPHLLDVEVTHILCRHAKKHPEQADRCRQALTDLARMPIFRYAHAPLFDRVWELRDEMPASCATYVALAELLDAPVLTLDDRLETRGHKAGIELLSTAST